MVTDIDDSPDRPAPALEVTVRGWLYLRIDRLPRWWLPITNIVLVALCGWLAIR